MNKAEALKILGLDSSASDDDIKKQFRKLAAKTHPDVNKNENAEEEYKKLSEAFEYLKDPKDETPMWPNVGHGFGFSGDFFRNFNGFGRRQVAWNPPAARASVKISFVESVLGCSKKVKIERYVPCSECSGLGMKQTSEKCPKCDGNGGTENVQRNGNQVFVMRMECGACHGLGYRMEKCNKCSSGSNKEAVEADVQIPGGIQNGQTLRLRGAGNVSFFQGMGTRDDAFIAIGVEQDPDMKIVGKDVISTINVSLHDALSGKAKKVRTVKGDITIKIPKKSRHSDTVKLSGYGVNSVGNHVFVLDVKYPEDVSDIVKILESKSEKE